MVEKDTPFENYSLKLFRVGEGVGRLLHSVFRMPRPLSSHGDHFAKSPLDEPIIQPATDWFEGERLSSFSTTPVPDVAGRDLGQRG